jgi:uncharacterized membrane protein
MEKMLVVVFDSEAKVNKGADALKELDQEGTVSVYAGAIIKKNKDGTVTALDYKEEWPIRAVGGTAIGSLIGLLGGPVGVVLGASSGTILGAFADLYHAGVSAEFLDEVASTLATGKYALVAEMSEEEILPLDTKMEALGGQVFRTRKSYVEEDQLQGDIDELNADIDRWEKEMADSRAEHKAKLQTKIEKAKQKRDKKVEQMKQRRAQAEKEHHQKIEALKTKSAKVRSDRKAAIEARITQINNNYHNAVAKVKNSHAEKLEKVADRLDQKAQQLKTGTTK